MLVTTNIYLIWELEKYFFPGQKNFNAKPRPQTRQGMGTRQKRVTAAAAPSAA
jgi:hypothetical protein